MSSSDSADLVHVLEEDGTPLEVTEMEATSLQSLLEANGIQAVIVGAEMMPNLPYRVQVPTDQAKQAADIIAEARAAGSEGAEEAEQAGEVSGDVAPIA
jgi:hypothetical protein